MNEHRSNDWQTDDNGQGAPAAIAPVNSQPVVATTQPLAGNSRPTGPANKHPTLDEVHSEITQREAGLCRDRFPVSNVRVETDRVIAGDKEFRLGTEGLRRLCKRFQAPADYLGKLSSKLRASILQEHFAEGRFADDKLNDKSSYILSRGGTFLDIGRSDLLTLDNTSVVQALRDGVAGDAPMLKVQNFHLDDESFSLDVVSPRIADEVRPGDVLHGGLHLSHSQRNGEATQVMPFVVRLLCTNGMVRRQCLGENYRSTPRTRRLAADRPEAKDMQMAQIRKLVAATWGGLQQMLSAICRLKDKTVEVPISLDRFLRQAHLFSRTLMSQLLHAWEQEGGETTAFGALNALTRVATHSPNLPPWQRQRLSRLAGLYANQDVHLCPHCFSILANR
jgi:hypothetical protein